MDRLDVKDFQYDLPAEKIAHYPLKDRDQSKLLVYEGGKIRHSVFNKLAVHLPPGSFLFFNNTKVIPARIHFRKSTGASIEIFLLHPLKPSAVLAETMNAREESTWQCTIGNLKRWGEDSKLIRDTPGFSLMATLNDREHGIVTFTWTSQHTFAEMIAALGETPLPPYLNRKPQANDRENYQTIYSRHEGAVAAPTAGLHFTDSVFQSLAERKIDHDFVTLHVSAGTFQPIKAANAHEHIMHEEQIVVTRVNIRNLLANSQSIVAVGTTSLRTLESIYWFGVKALHGVSELRIHQDDPDTLPGDIALAEALRSVLRWMDETGRDTIVGETAIFIRPGYRFRVCRALVTNFHQPASTLILLVAAFIGDDWRKVYHEALSKNYRFLSYGDSSLLIPGN
jgi:S-adenosylmethionine:tRNA ribosyltransferase-isomerase